MKTYGHYINGKHIKATNNETFESIDPYTGEVWAKIARGSSTEIDLAVESAKNALNGEWGTYTPSKRGKLLFLLANLVEKNAERLADIEVQDNGKLIAEMGAQTAYMGEWYRYYGGLADKIEGSVIPSDKSNTFNYTRFEPLGVIGMITPWNSPLLLLAWKLAPALAAGNTAVVKPSEFASASTIEFMDLIEQAGFPPGVVNAVTGYGPEVGVPLVRHKDVAKIAFTGSDVSGQKVYEEAASGFKRVSLEMGGKSPNIVFDDADIEAAVMGAISGIFAATGQTCIAGSRLLLQKSIHDDFVKRLVKVAKDATIGDPKSLETHIGPVTTLPQYQKILDYIAIAKNEGAECILGGEPYTGPGAKGCQFVQPTIFTGVNNGMRIAQEEVFGPVLSIIPFNDEEEAVKIANDIDFGLAAGIWTSDIGRSFRMSENLKAGIVWVNTYRAVSYTSPFGGYKQSGLGRESGLNAIYEYLQTKSVWISTKTSIQNPFVLG
ncbi:MAG: aldehyde dehydrogenase [Pseudomonadota bacterium]|nr:aldehyde dehydrogenase [Pseudomonadota bacterium]